MEQRCPRVNHPSHTMAKFRRQTGILKINPHVSRIHNLRERLSAKQYCLKHERTNAPNVVSTACKDLTHLNCFNSDKRGQAMEEQRHLRRLVTVLTTSTLATETKESTLERVSCI